MVADRLGTLLCVGCCAAPILLAAGVLGGGITVGSLSWLEPLGFVLIVHGVAGLVWSRARARGKRCTNGTDSTAACTGSGFGCATAIEPSITHRRS